MNDLFYEIEYDSVPIAGIEPISGVGRFVLKPQLIKEIERDEISERFYQMRRLSNAPLAEVFYKQGMFMKDFSDHYSGDAKEFSEYYPSYQMMGHEQLRAYFTWRTDVRQGNISDTCLSYAFVYIYELLNNIGVKNSQDERDNSQNYLYMLISFWSSFRVYNHIIDKYVLQWLRDYHTYYDLPQTFEEFVFLNNLQQHYPEDFLCDAVDLESWNKISSYNITKSRFYANGNEALIKDCFEYVMSRLIKQIQLKALIFTPVNFERDAFNGALFFNHLNKPPIQRTRLFVTDNGKQLIGYIIKQTEVVLRRLTKYKYKINAISPIEGLDLKIEQAVIDYYAELNRTVVEVDFWNLERIREEALGTQDKLIICEEQEEINHEVQKTENQIENDFISIELKALSILLNGENLKQFADEHGIMLEVLVDAINQKTMDLIGDNLIDEDFALYEDYINKAKEFISNGSAEQNS